MWLKLLKKFWRGKLCAYCPVPNGFTLIITKTHIFHVSQTSHWTVQYTVNAIKYHYKQSLKQTKKVHVFTHNYLWADRLEQMTIFR